MWIKVVNISTSTGERTEYRVNENNVKWSGQDDGRVIFGFVDGTTKSFDATEGIINKFDLQQGGKNVRRTREKTT